MTKQKRLNEKALKRACLQVADNVLWEKGPRPIEPIQNLAEKFFEIAKEKEKYLVDGGRDPNMLTRIVRYLAYQHAIPPMRDDIWWFYQSLHILVNLVDPISPPRRIDDQLYSEIQEGVAEARSSFARKSKSSL